MINDDSYMLSDAVEAVRRFMRAGEQTVRDNGEYPELGAFVGDEEKLRLDMLLEEVEELRDGCVKGDLTEIADALADIIYVAIGTAIFHGIPLARIFDEVHRSNIAKIVDGKVLRNKDGKVIKPAGWKAPDVEGILWDEAKRLFQRRADSVDVASDRQVTPRSRPIAIRQARAGKING